MPYKTPPPESFLPLHPVDLRILLVLSAKTAHGYRIVQEIESKEERLPSIYPGNLYRRIKDLREKGLIADAPAPPNPEVDSRRKYFRITALGKAVAQEESLRLGDLVAEARSVGLLPESS